ncbi:hypothetical protein NC652_002448 [Populus alba x Populus x berolinensis]|uniref:Uncharacterized protein n=1 Tax=Populus alba x Populus x berolinensis TaxID=444605 RepID=A0AAD6WH07_9ROSI|nr:hypothetical protein NC652_002448 [Populus alba x Populus x berolinensis]KAJ7012485.1 hypothetical protein NC653_002515 [Populus alba x Populus x berolinensis]
MLRPSSCPAVTCTIQAAFSPGFLTTTLVLSVASSYKRQLSERRIWKLGLLIILIMMLIMLMSGFCPPLFLHTFVQALVYLILSISSNIFSKTHRERRSSSFKIARSVSIQRILAALQDLPAGGELSPASSKTTPMQSPTVERSKDRRSCFAD